MFPIALRSSGKARFRVLNSAMPSARVQFWGTRGSLAKPGPATLRYGGNTSCVQLTSPSGALVVIGTLMVTMTTVSFYMITAYTPTFGSAVLHLRSVDSLIVTLCVGASNLFWLPTMGALSDRGDRP
jgi:hypothetical protein